MNAQQIKEILLSFSDDEKSKVLSRFFKTSKGAYGEGDCFIGVPVPIIRSIAKRYRKEVSLSEAEVLLDESIHECRMLGLLLMVALFEQSDNQTKKAIFDSYLLHTYAINNWDLVDLTAYQIVGRYLIDKDRSILYSLAKSDNRGLLLSQHGCIYGKDSLEIHWRLLIYCCSTNKTLFVRLSDGCCEK